MKSSAEIRQYLIDQREIALLNCPNAIQFVLSMFEAQDFEQSRKYLQDAFDQFQLADRNLAKFQLQEVQSIRRGEKDHGNRAA